MQYFHTDDMTTINWLAGVLNHASTDGLKVRIAVEGTSLKVKLGEGAWTAPLSGTPDPYRDGPQHECDNPECVSARIGLKGNVCTRPLRIVK